MLNDKCWRLKISATKAFATVLWTVTGTCLALEILVYHELYLLGHIALASSAAAATMSIRGFILMSMEDRRRTYDLGRKAGQRDRDDNVAYLPEKEEML